jgi:hypothetical protein
MCWYVSAIDTIGRLLGQTSKANTVSYAHKRQIPSKDQFPWVWIFVAGVVPFGCVMYVATFSIMSRILWGRAYYPSPSNLTLLLQLLVLVCSHGSQLLTFPNSPFRGSPPVVEDRFFLRLIGILSVSILPQLSLGWSAWHVEWLCFDSHIHGLLYSTGDHSHVCNLLNRVAAIILSCASCLYGESEIFGNLNRDQQLTLHLVQ